MRKKHLISILLISLLGITTLLNFGKFPGSGMTLVAFFILFSGCLFLELSRYAEDPGDKGRISVYTTSFLIIIFIAFLWFKILELQGAPLLGLIAVPLMCAFFPIMTSYFLRTGKQAVKHGLIRFIQEKQAYFERSALVIICFSILLNIDSIFFRAAKFIPVIFLIFSVTLTGLVIYSNTWTQYTKDNQHSKSQLLAITSSIALIMFLIPILGRNNVGQLMGNIMAYGSYIIYITIIIIYYARYSNSSNKKILTVITSLILLYPIFKFGLNLNLFQLPGYLANNIGLHITLLFLFILLFISYRKDYYFKWLMVLTIVSHIFPSSL